MYPDRATFARMVEEVPDLTAAGRQTLLTLYDGPLRLRQILAAVNTQDSEGPAGKKETRDISESALRKRLEVLISRGIVARAGSERINPFYFIRRQWLFNYYIMTKCREGPGAGLLDLTILLHEISRQNRDGTTRLPPPRFIAAFGERTERGHQVTADYAAFKKHLGDSAAIGDYLEGIYADIYEDRIPSSDIDSSLARDFLRFVAVAPEEESEARFFLWYALFFHTLDLHEAALETFDRGVVLAQERGLDLAGILEGSRITRGSILLYLNDITGARNAFLDQYATNGTGPVTKARCIFGAGAIDLLTRDTQIAPALSRFSLAENLCHDADPNGTNMDVQELLGDILRMTGAACRLAGDLSRAESCCARAKTIYTEGGMFRGIARLLPEQAELLRARAFASTGTEQAQLFAAAARKFEEAKAAAQRTRNIRGYAHAMIGECELARLAFQLAGRPLPSDQESKYESAFEIYCQIDSRFGIVKMFLSEALLYHYAAEQFPDKYADTADKLEQAARFSSDLGLNEELALIRRIRNHRDPSRELNPLIFL